MLAAVSAFCPFCNCCASWLVLSIILRRLGVKPRLSLCRSHYLRERGKDFSVNGPLLVFFPSNPYTQVHNQVVRKKLLLNVST